MSLLLNLGYVANGKGPFIPVGLTEESEFVNLLLDLLCSG